MTSSKQSEEGKRKKKDKAGWLKKKKKRKKVRRQTAMERILLWSQRAWVQMLTVTYSLSDFKQGLSYKILSSGKTGITVVTSWYNN